MTRLFFVPAVALLSLASAAAAQDFGVRWADRVTHELHQERGPLQPKATATSFTLGGLYAYDNNIFLEEDHEDSNSILIPFVGLRMDNSTQLVDMTLDGLANWKEYVQDDDESGHEERLYGFIRYVTGSFEVQLAEIYRHETDPIDAIFADRIDRIVSDTVPRLAVDFLPFAVELGADIGIVRMLDGDFDKVDNTNIRADLTLLYKTQVGYDFMVQAGWLSIDYRYETGAPSDVDGMYVRGGLRGTALPTVNVQLLVGFSSAEAEDETVPGAGEADESGADVDLHIRYEATPRLTIYADFIRQFTFSTAQLAGDPFQTLNRVVGMFEWQAEERLKVQLRIQYDTIETPSGDNERDYLAVGPWLQWKYIDRMYFELGGTWRTGEVDGGEEYDNIIIQAGVVVTN